jgi:hypothetical protein
MKNAHNPTSVMNGKMMRVNRTVRANFSGSAANPGAISRTICGANATPESPRAHSTTKSRVSTAWLRLQNSFGALRAR